MTPSPVSLADPTERSSTRRRVCEPAGRLLLPALVLLSALVLAIPRHAHAQGGGPEAGGGHPLPEMVGRPAGLPGPRPAASEPGEILVKLREGAVAARALRQRGLPGAVGLQSVPQDGFRESLRLAGVQQIEPVFRVAGLSETPRVRVMGIGGKPAIDPAKRDSLFRWYRLRLSEGIGAEEAIAALQAAPDVEVAEPNLHYRLAGEIPPPISGLPDGTTDPGIDEQWHLAATRTYNGWNHLKQNGLDTGGSRDVIVAVIDTGVDATHEDLVANMWNNSGEIPNNGLDDDGNGFVDDIHGCSVVSAVESHSGDSSDFNGHGTHVGGVVAATAFNQAGGVGMAFNVQIMAVRAAQYSGTLTTADVAEGILYAIDHGAEVLNMSFGGYARSQVMEDALEVALSQAMLVAAAGNDQLPAWLYPFYPAALHYVHGVMAATPPPTISLAWFSNYGYDVTAPGVSIYSTLPGNSYAKWSGTSMAAPVVSGMGALLRSYYWQRDVYPVRFLMGSIWASPQPSPEGNPGLIVDTYNALTLQPPPGVTLYEDWLFDDTGIHPNNDGDGRADSGETLEIGLELINRAGFASQVIARLEAHAEGAVLPDPYVSIDVPLVDWGPMGPFVKQDNGFLYDEEGVITGVAEPFVFTISPDCPNDHVIEFKLTIDFEDGWDEEHPWYTRVCRFNYVVQRGKVVPTVIAAGTTYTLTSDQYWIVGGPVLVEAGAALNIEPGAQVQWGAVSEDPYNPGPQNGHLVVRGEVEATGTLNAPIAMFPSYLVEGQTVRVTVEGSGTANLGYARVKNPELRGMNHLDHCYLEWDRFASAVTAVRIANSQFHKFRGGGEIAASAGFDNCLFDAGWIVPGPVNAPMRRSAFLQDNENQSPLTLAVPWALSRNLTLEDSSLELFYNPMFADGQTYVVMPLERGGLRLAETMARYYGGHVTSVRDQAEYDLIKTWIAGVPMIAMTMNWFVVGLSDLDAPGELGWTDGTSLVFTDWQPGQPVASDGSGDRLVVAGEEYRGGGKTWGWYVQDESFYTRWNGEPDWWKNFLLRVPGDWSIADLSAPIQDGSMLGHVLAQFPGTWVHNAFLSPYWNPNVSRWMRLVSPMDPDGYSLLRDNYFGTASQTLIDHAIIDYYDNFTSARIEYGSPPAEGYPTTYPFVQRVEINGANTVSVPELGAGEATFRVVFNRDMDQTIEPFVTFGPSSPHTDFQVKARDASFIEIPSGWVDARTWEGKAWITPVTGNGYHLMRVSGAVAADDSWLVSGYDVGRFRFEVATASLESMNLQVNGLEGRIDLSWLQDDYDLLAGYNLYRAGSSEGPFTRLNQTVIPPDQLTYVDTDVLPAVRMYYRFTVMTTDSQESDPSETVSAAATDTIPPTLAHTPVVAAVAGRGLRLTASATDNVRVTGVVLRYRPMGSSDPYTAVAMLNASGDLWSSTIPASSIQPPGVEYYLTASDGLNDVLNGTAATPHAVLVENQPTLASVSPNRGTAAGGTVVTLAGTQFQVDASVWFGTEPAANVSIISANQITCETPAHFPAQVDVKVLNPDETQARLLNGFRFEASGMTLSLPAATGDHGTVVELALTADNATGLRAAELVIAFDPAVLTPVDAQIGAWVADWGLSYNTATPGQLRLTMAGSGGVSGSGVLADLRFNVVGMSPAATALTIQSALLNDGALTAQLSHGQFAVNGNWSLAGTVVYYQESRPVPGVELDMVGAGVHQTTSGADGTFALADLPTASYSLLPEKSGDIDGITAYDASLVLQKSAGTLTLSAHQTLAADVNRNGLVSAMDASYILEKAVELLTLPFPGAGQVWDFDPGQRDYALLSGDQTGQDFTAILIGDVSGNWGVPPVIAGGEPDPEPVVLAVRRAELTDSGLSRWWVLARVPDAGLHGIDLDLGFDEEQETTLTLQPERLAAGLVMARNDRQPGRLRVAAAGARPVRGVGALVLVTAPGKVEDRLRIHAASADEGRVRVRVDESGTEFDSDTDGDRQTDWHEVLSGTDPGDHRSVLALRTAVRQSDGGVRVEWSSVVGHRYQLQSANAVGKPVWADAGPVVTAKGESAAQTDRPSGAARLRLYRVVLVE